EAPLFDDQQLASLEGAISAEDMAELINSFLDGAKSRLDRIVQMVERGELGPPAKEAHDLVGTAGNFGVQRISSRARAPATACKAGGGDAARTLARSITEVSAQSWQAIENRFLKKAS